MDSFMSEMPDEELALLSELEKDFLIELKKVLSNNVNITNSPLSNAVKKRAVVFNEEGNPITFETYFQRKQNKQQAANVSIQHARIGLKGYGLSEPLLREIYDLDNALRVELIDKSSRSKESKKELKDLLRKHNDFENKSITGVIENTKDLKEKALLQELQSMFSEYNKITLDSAIHVAQANVFAMEKYKHLSTSETTSQDEQTFAEEAKRNKENSRSLMEIAGARFTTFNSLLQQASQSIMGQLNHYQINGKTGLPDEATLSALNQIKPLDLSEQKTQTLTNPKPNPVAEKFLENMMNKINKLPELYRELEAKKLIPTLSNENKIAELQKDLQDIAKDKKLSPQQKITRIRDTLENAYTQQMNAYKKTYDKKNRSFLDYLTSSIESNFTPQKFIDHLNDGIDPSTKQDNLEHNYSRLVGMLLHEAYSIHPDEFVRNVYNLNNLKQPNNAIYQSLFGPKEDKRQSYTQVIK